MKKFLNSVWHYIKEIWSGPDSKPSLRAILAIAFSIDLISNTSHAFYKWDGQRSMEGAALLLGVESALIVALLGLSAYTNISNKRIDAGVPNNSSINVDKANIVTNSKTVPQGPPIEGSSES